MSAAIVGEWPTGVERFIDEIVVSAAMKLIRPRLHGDVKQAASRLAEFGCVVAGLMATS